jgi:hypothetical protein
MDYVDFGKTGLKVSRLSIGISHQAHFYENLRLVEKLAPQYPLRARP